MRDDMKTLLLIILLFANQAIGQVAASVAPGRTQPALSRIVRPVPVSITGNLVAHWKLGEADGTTREDSVGNNDLLDTFNSVGQTTGPSGVGNAALFDALSAGLTCADNVALRMGDFDCTWTGWFNVTGDPFFTDNFCFFSKTTAGNLGYELTYHGPTDLIEFVLFNTGGTEATATSLSAVLPDTGWHFFVCGWNKAAGQVFISIDNGADATASLAGTPRAGTTTFMVGKVDSTDVFEDGALAGISKYDRLLTPAERTFLYNGGNGRAWPY